jgi:hypothetical protein
MGTGVSCIGWQYKGTGVSCIIWQYMGTGVSCIVWQYMGTGVSCTQQATKVPMYVEHFGMYLIKVIGNKVLAVPEII